MLCEYGMLPGRTLCWQQFKVENEGALLIFSYRKFSTYILGAESKFYVKDSNMTCCRVSRDVGSILRKNEDALVFF